MIASYRFNSGLGSLNYDNDYQSTPSNVITQPGVLTIGRTTDYMQKGPVTLTNRLRVRVDFKQLQTMLFGHNNSFMNYIPTPGMVWSGPDKREIFTRMRFSISVSINKGVLNSISIRGKGIIKLHQTKSRYDIPVTIGARYRLNTGNLLVFIRLFNVEF